MIRRTITTTAAVGLIALGGLAVGAGPALAENSDPSGPSITLDYGTGTPAQAPPAGPAQVYTPPQVGTAPEMGGMQFETADGTPLNLQSADGIPLDISAIPPGGSVQVYGPGGPGPLQQAPAEVIPAEVAPAESVLSDAQLQLEVEQAAKSAKEFGDMLIAVAAVALVVIATIVVLIVRSVRKRRGRRVAKPALA
ncbi:MAG: hypothetical protein JWM01_824 [Arthrobacter sp.]|jgi:hypothetical protein|nr:hypothetical protein [Arthrobacter sp.]